MQTEPVLLLDEVAEVCGVSRSTVSGWINDDENPLPTVKVGGNRTAVRPEVLVAFAKARNMLTAGDPHAVARPWPRTEQQDGGSAA